jgi:hypothetical protein
MAKMAMLVVTASRTKATVWLSGLRLAGTTGLCPVGLRPRPLREGAAVSGAVDQVAGGAEALADRAECGVADDAVLHEPGGLRLVGVGARAAWLRSWVLTFNVTWKPRSLCSLQVLVPFPGLYSRWEAAR